MSVLGKGLVILAYVMFMVRMAHANDCSCICSGRRSQTVCESVEELKKVGDSNTKKLMEWERYRPFVERFSERWKKEIADIVEMKINEYIKKEKIFPKPEYLMIKNEDDTEDESNMILKPPDKNGDLVSNLIAKVEKVENRTIEVEEELKSERRVRRHLEQEVKETRTSLIYLGDQLLNVTFPVDAMMDQVQTVIHSSLEDMNRTIYEEHLKKLYYKVDGVVYKNETKKLDERIDHVETELHDNDNSSIVFKLIGDLKTLEENFYLLNNSIGDTVVPRIETLNNSIEQVLVPKVETLESETVRKDAVEDLDYRMATLLNNTELFKTALVDVWVDIQDVRTFEKKFHNFSEEWAKSLETLQKQVEHLKNQTVSSTPFESSDDEDSEIAQMKVIDSSLRDENSMENVDYTMLEPEDLPNVVDRSRISENDTVDDNENGSAEPDVLPIVVDRTRIGGGDQVNISCPKPVIDDPHLLVDVVTDTFGIKKLKFGCQPIGSYVVSHLPVPPRCEEDEWKEPFPSCRKLFDVPEIESLASELRKQHPCVNGLGEFPDPFNCSQFFKCGHGKFSIIPCPSGLNFNSQLKVCDYARTTPCELLANNYDKELENLIPPISIDPGNLDKSGSHLGTGTSGQLIVHPRTSFTLHCLYPQNVWGYPRWKVQYAHTSTNTRYLVPKEESNGISLRITAAEEADSGIYSCSTPFGVHHDVEVAVKVVTCPSFTLDDEYEDVFYQPSPEGELRIMGTTAKFFCEGGYSVTAQCMSDGSWSRGLPTEEECTLKKRDSNNTWNCRPFDLSKHPDLIVERNDVEKIITFKCAGGKRIFGNSFTRCTDEGFWSHVSLPKCKR